MPKTVYPDWVLQWRTRGTAVKRVGNSYYLYKRTSRRVPGKKYPQAVDTYIGVITPEGVIEGNRKKVSVSGIEVREYGFSKTVWEICPESWKKLLGDDWEDVLSKILVDLSPNSYISKERKINEESVSRYQIRAQKLSLNRRLLKECGVDLHKDLAVLKTIYLLYLDKGTAVSAVNEAQMQLLNRLGVNLEMC